MTNAWYLFQIPLGFTRQCVLLYEMSTRLVTRYHLPVTIPVARKRNAAQTGADAIRKLFVMWSMSDGSWRLLMTLGRLRTI
jgi:hypothetical protein